MSYLGQGLGLGREERFTVTATTGQTTLTTDDLGRGLAYTPGYVDVYLNGVKMVNGQDVTVTSGTSVVFASALAAGDIVDIVAPGYFQPADTVSRSLGGTFLGAVNLPSGGLNVGSGQLKVDSSGRVTMSNQPVFRARRTTSFVLSTTAWTVIAYDAADTNIGANYNSSTGRFTAPVAGAYYFRGHVQPTGSGYNVNINFQKNGGLLSHTQMGWTSLPARSDIAVETILQLAAGDYVEVAVAVATAGQTFDNHGVFCGHLIG